MNRIKKHSPLLLIGYAVVVGAAALFLVVAPSGCGPSSQSVNKKQYMSLRNARFAHGEKNAVASCASIPLETVVISAKAIPHWKQLWKGHSHRDLPSESISRFQTDGVMALQEATRPDAVALVLDKGEVDDLFTLCSPETSDADFRPWIHIQLSGLNIEWVPLDVQASKETELQARNFRTCIQSHIRSMVIAYLP